MQLPGRLDSSTLGDILGTLYRGNATGVLELSEVAATSGATRHGRTHRIHLLSGMVAGVETELDVTPIGELLARAGKLDARAIDVMLYRMALGDPRPAGAILVSMGAVAPEALVAGLRAQLHAKVEAIYKGLADARVAFRMSRPLPKDALRIGTLMPRDFLHGRQRKRDRRASPRPVQSPPPSTREPRWAANHWSTQQRPAYETPAPASGSRARDHHAQAPGTPPATPRTAALRTLGLPHDADETSVRRAFKRLAMEMHPDRHVTSPEEVRAKHAARFAEASAAYHLLVA
jgi:hypothetical protein